MSVNHMDLSPGQKRVIRNALVVGAVIGAIGLGVAVASVPNTFSSGEALSSSQMNANFSNVDSRITAIQTGSATFSGMRTFSLGLQVTSPGGGQGGTLAYFTNGGSVFPALLAVNQTAYGDGGLLLMGNTVGNNYGNLNFSLQNSAANTIIGAGITGVITSVTAGAESMDLALATKSASGASVTQLTIKSSGEVGIGTTSPAAALDVEGTTPGLKVGATCVSGTCPSDVRLKDDIRYLNGAVAMLSRLKPAEYRFKSDPARQVGYGLIAQDVQATAPALVEKGTDGILRVNYAPLQMMLVEATKELEQENAALRAANTALEARLRRIEAQLTHPSARD